MKEMGEYLKSERLNQGLSPETLAMRAGISISVLKAIEEGELEWIGTPMLIRGFVRSYCTALGMDPVPILEKHCSEIGSYDQQGLGMRSYQVRSHAFRRKSRLGFFSLSCIGIAILALLYGALWISDRQSRQGIIPQAGKDTYPQQELPSDLPKRAVRPSPPNSKPELPLEAERKAGTAPESVPLVAQKPEEPRPADNVAEAVVPPLRTETYQGSEQPETAALPAKKMHVFTVEASAPTWINVKIDGQTTRSASLKPGKKRSWEAEKTMQIVVGDSQAVQMTWDQQPVKHPKTGKFLLFNLPDPRYLKEDQAN
jgi:cytoskeletal protein RodZ